jgi:hypothetical protein
VTKKGLALSAVLLVFLSSLIFLSCKKINEATELGGNLLPAIDNISTFDTTLSVETFNLLFTDQEDTTSSSVLQFLGNINNDPLFGKSEGTMYFDLFPTAIKNPFPFVKDSLVGLDSIVLVLGYNNTYGDTTGDQQVEVFEIPSTETFNVAENYQIRKNYISTLGASLGPAKTFIPVTLNDSVFPRDERAANQLRIPLNKSFGLRLLNYDTTNAYASEAAFKTYFNGFAVVPQNSSSANALVGFDLSSANTKLAFYVRYKNAGKIDTATVNFALTNSSAIANYIKRDYSGAEIAIATSGTTPDDLVYLQSSPGSYARIKIPGLGTLNNRVVHLADLIVEQIYDPLATILTPPNYLYLDALDTLKHRYRTIPYDVALTVINSDSAGTNVAYSIDNTEQFGMIGRKETDNSNNSVYKWHFNISRYVQHIVNGTEKAQELRLYSPFPTIHANSNGIEQFINSGQPYAIGRVRVGGGNHPTQKMRLRLVYSKL